METFQFTDMLIENFLFKSYYVVWKPRNVPGVVATAVVFKSYYVVWKQDWTTAMKYVELSLNRTM